MHEDDVFDLSAEAFAKASEPFPSDIMRILKADKSEMEEIKRTITPEQLQYIARMLQEHKSWIVRKGFTTILIRLGKDGGVDPLIGALGDEDWQVRHSAAYGVGKLEGYITNGRFKRLMDGVRSEDWRTREAHCLALGYMTESLRGIGKKGVIEALVCKLNDVHPMVRARAAFSLGNIGKVLRLKQAMMLKPLIEKLNDPEPLVRTAVIHSLGELRNYSASEHLVPLLGDADPDVREAAEKAVVKVSDIGKVFVDALAGRKVDLSKVADYAPLLEKLARSEHPTAREKAKKLSDDIHMDPESRSKYRDSMKFLKVRKSISSDPALLLNGKPPK